MIKPIHAIKSEHPAYQSYHAFLLGKKEQNLHRSYKQPLDQNQQKQAVFFNQNDYLYLSQHPKVIQASQEYAATWGTGSGSTRMLTCLPIYEQLEQMIAQTKHQAKAIIFNSGYQANTSIIASLLDQRLFTEPPLVFCDRLNHASMHQGCRLAGVRQIRYRHLDLNHLEYLLQKQPYQPNRPRFIITESLFSMDGDQVDMAALIPLAKQYHAFLYIDEAHATGVLGEEGHGLTSGYEDQIDLIMGTFSKALGSTGGYLCCNTLLHDYLLNHCHGLIYSTALSPAVIGAVHQAWQLLPEMTQERHHLKQLADYTRNQLKQRGYDTGQSDSHIIPVIIGDAAKTLHLCRQLEQQNIYTAAIRPPTVPANSSRIRLSLQSNHDQLAVDRLLNTLSSILSIA